MEVEIDKDIKIKDSLFDPQFSNNDVAVYSKSGDGKYIYKVYLYLEGRDTFLVDSVTYKLHPTFSERIRKVKRTLSNQNCRLIIWTWGLFNVEAEIILKTGEKLPAQHYMSYDREFKKDGLRFIEERK
jgi:hypothetical protein